MTIANKFFRKTTSAVAYLEKLAYDPTSLIVFRGHANQRHRLQTTWQRHILIRHEVWNTDIDDALLAYATALQKAGLETPDTRDRFFLMEHARHHGVPTPCLDFSYSPYVALFFAFNGVRKSLPERREWSVVYALDVKALAFAWAAFMFNPRERFSDFHNAFRDFVQPIGAYFDSYFPSDALRFIPYPGKTNRRMQRQLGCLIYDTLDHRGAGRQDFEGYLNAIKEPAIFNGVIRAPGPPVLQKIHILQECVGEVFRRLEVMNINGVSLFGSGEGAAYDVQNSYNYAPRFSLLHGIEAPKFDLNDFDQD